MSGTVSITSCLQQKENPPSGGFPFVVVVDFVERAVTTYFFGGMFVLCNFRLFVTLLERSLKRKHNDKNNNNLPPAFFGAILTSMSILATPTAPIPVKTKESKKISIFYAAILMVLAVTQLFTFEEFLEVYAGMNLPGGGATGYVVASLIVFAEVFAIPFLLRMYLSITFRVVSMVLGWLVAVVWFLVSLWVVTTAAPVPTIGFLGTVVDVMPGLWAILISACFGILAGWSAWGLWLFGRPAAKKK